jgi:hypothetical protein
MSQYCLTLRSITRIEFGELVSGLARFQNRRAIMELIKHNMIMVKDIIKNENGEFVVERFYPSGTIEIVHVGQVIVIPEPEADDGET